MMTTQKRKGCLVHLPRTMVPLPRAYHFEHLVRNRIVVGNFEPQNIDYGTLKELYIWCAYCPSDVLREASQF